MFWMIVLDVIRNVLLFFIGLLPLTTFSTDDTIDELYFTFQTAINAANWIVDVNFLFQMIQYAFLIEAGIFAFKNAGFILSHLPFGGRR